LQLLRLLRLLLLSRFAAAAVTNMRTEARSVKLTNPELSRVVSKIETQHSDAQAPNCAKQQADLGGTRVTDMQTATVVLGRGDMGGGLIVNELWRQIDRSACLHLLARQHRCRNQPTQTNNCGFEHISEDNFVSPAGQQEHHR
jgi:hypothetical protein